MSGKKLAVARRRAGLSQSKLGEIIERTVSSVSKIERQNVANVFHGVRPSLIAALKMSEGEFADQIEVQHNGEAAPELTRDEKLDALTEMSESYGLEHDDVIAHFQRLKLKSDPRIHSGSDFVKHPRNAALQSDAARSKAEGKRRGKQ